MVPAWIGTIAFCTIQLLMIRHGSGVDIQDVPEADLEIFLNLFLDSQITARLSIFFARTSILLLYIRIFFPLGTARSAWWWVIQITITINLLFTIAFVLVTILQCAPYGLPFGSQCVNQWLVLVIASVINIVSDIAVLLIPLASIWNLQMSRQRKWATGALFAFGALAPVASIIRLGYQIPQSDSPNYTVIYTIIALTATGEQAVAVVIGSAPICNALIVRMMRGKRARAPNRNVTFSQRLWPSRERQAGTPEKRIERKIRYPFRITDIVGTNSTDILYSRDDAGHSDGAHQEYVELHESNTTKVDRQE
ncbi:hypothetical protein F4821DRAFT_196842 [Hypoxylon rubiginosum]|uniref:Uncharacterized protein n=1 Tax=Hypoxylon rubiginosum TaxID=110542 RepID=A0ACC0CRW5_9PEZI|nr:hypothetical protein F4821DRAFT_196842 [Hypoxylon rubiginosum]